MTMTPAAPPRPDFNIQRDIPGKRKPSQPRHAQIHHALFGGLLGLI